MEANTIFSHASALCVMCVMCILLSGQSGQGPVSR